MLAPLFKIGQNEEISNCLNSNPYLNIFRSSKTYLAPCIFFFHLIIDFIFKNLESMPYTQMNSFLLCSFKVALAYQETHGNICSDATDQKDQSMITQFFKYYNHLFDRCFSFTMNINVTISLYDKYYNFKRIRKYNQIKSILNSEKL